MKFSLESGDLSRYVAAQLNNIFPDSQSVSPEWVGAFMPECLERLRRCFENIRQKYFWDEQGPTFNHLNADHYAMFLYLLGNAVYKKEGDVSSAEKLYCLNKALHGLDAFYSIELPEVFMFVHPLGTVLGKAEYGGYFAAYQNCTVGSNEDGVYPRFGEGVILYCNASVIGDCRIGDNVVIGANAALLNDDVESDHVATGRHPHLKISRNGESVVSRRFRK